MSRSQRPQDRRPLLPRALWMGMLFALLSCISLINPRVARGKTSIAERDAPPDAPPTLWRRLARSLEYFGEAPALPLPEPDDQLVFFHGIPVVPWLKRVGLRQWKPWLDHLRLTFRLRYPERTEFIAGADWEEWLRRHVSYLEVHFARLAGGRIAQLAAAMSSGPGALYLFGHSAGGSAVLQYLADLRDGAVPAPARPIRAALTLDAAVTGPARAWTGWPVANERPNRVDRLVPRIQASLVLNDPQPHWRRRLTWARNYQEWPFPGLGAWAREQGFALLTVSNIADTFTHAALSDIPFLRLRIGRRFDLRGMLNGKTHLCIQRDPRMPPFLWWDDHLEPV